MWDQRSPLPDHFSLFCANNYIFLMRASAEKFRFIVAIVIYCLRTSKQLGPDYMSRAGPVNRAASVCRDDFQAGITLGEPARLIG